MTLDFSRCRLTPFAHQREDAEWLTRTPWALIASEMRTGKSKIVVDAAQFMFEAGVIDRVLVVAPAPVRDVWYDKELGEIAKHSWHGKPATVSEFHARTRQWYHAKTDKTLATKDVFQYLVTNYEFIRSKNRLTQLLPFCGPKTLLVLDESSYVKNHAAAQTKACMQLRAACGRVVLLNGTPIFHSPMDLFSQGNLMHPSILDCKFVTHFKARYAKEEAVLGSGGRALTSPHGRVVTKIVGWHAEGLADLQRRFAPYTVRRLQKDCLDLPPKLDPVALTATLDAEWPAYKDMRDEMVVWLKSGDVATSATAAIKALRLSQITGGFLGGVEGANVEEQFATGELIDAVDYGAPFDLPGSFLDGVTPTPEGAEALKAQSEYFNALAENERRNAQVGTLASQKVGRAKLDVLLWFLGQRLDADPRFKVVCWFRFRAELLRALAAVREKFPQFAVGSIHGGNVRKVREGVDERRDAMRLLHPDTSPDSPVFVGGIERTGSFGLNFTAASASIDYSSGYSPGTASQKNDRVYGPGMKGPCAYYSIVAVGPRGQWTIDHDILAARLNGEDVASRTSAAWVRALTEE